MSHNLALLIALGLPAIVFIALRINAAMVFLSLCLGHVLVQYVAPEADDLVRMALPHLSPISTSTMKLGLLLAPAVVTALVTIFSVHGRIKNLVNILPSAAASALVVLLGVPLLLPGIRFNLELQPVWHILWNAQAFVVAAGAAVSLVFLWTQRRYFKEPGKRKR